MAASLSEEDCAPLLKNEEVPCVNPVADGPVSMVSPPSTDQMPPPYNLNEPPPAYSSHPVVPSGAMGEPTVVCRVCHQLVFIRGRERQRVVKCSNCHEATPIKPPPTGKKYIRCPCNALLTCRATSTRISCPRQNCKRVISVGGGPPTASPAVTVPGGDVRIRVTCGHCNETFVVALRVDGCNVESLPFFDAAVTRTGKHLFRTTAHLARCPYCRKISSVGPRFAKNRALVFALIGMIFLAVGVGVTVGTYKLAAESGGIYVVWTGAFLVALLNLIRSCYYCSMTVSQIEGQS